MSPNGNVQATIDGEIKGQVAVGNYILQIGDVNGGVVNVAPQNLGPNYSRRAGPVNLRPRPFPTLLDRDNETATVLSALQIPTPVSLYGPAGIGKTSLLRGVAHSPASSTFPDGIVYLSVAGLGVEDILQALFDVFHLSQANFKPQEAEIRVAMQGIKALILLDDLSLNRDEVTYLLDAVQGCTFVLTSLERSLWGEGRIISLAGLPTEEALDLFVSELNRSLTVTEQTEVREICALLHGHPLKILQSASLVRERSKTILDLKSELQRDASEATLVEGSFSLITESQQRLLAILAAGGGAVVPEGHLGALSKSPDLKSDLQGLMSLGLIQAHSPRYSLAGNLTTALASLWDLSSWEDVLINYFVQWLSQQPAQMLVEEATDVLVATIKKAGEKKRWPEVIRLGRALERILILWKRWQTWQDILNLILEAARFLGDRKVEAWVLHQIGTRAACLGFSESGRGFLTQALQIRQAIGDQAGLAITQNNLHVFFNIPIPPNVGKSGCRRWLTCGAAGAGVTVIFGVIVAAILYLFSPSSKPEPSPTPIIITVVESATPVPVPSTEIPTITPSPTVPSPTPITPSVTPLPIVIDFRSDDKVVISGSCTFLQWTVQNASHVYLEGIEVGSQGNRQVCPKQPTTYTLRADSPAMSVERQVFVNTLDPYPPPGFVSSLGCYPWSHSDGATYYDPTLGCYFPLDTCLSSGNNCGKPPADAWCDLYTPYREAKSWVTASSGFYITRYIGSSNRCLGLITTCTRYESITCDITK
jgi:hypothetical protein